ncbi:MAG TPA: hypothetical protein VF746_13765 [Longimicrobium sp.]|jgi:hypothetical protein
MRRICVGVLGLLLLTAGELSAQRCRTHGRVTVCERDRDRDRDRDRERRRGPWRDAGPIEFGVRGGYDFEEEGGTAGAQFRIPLVRQLAIVPSADVFFDDDESASEWQINADAVLRPDALAGLYFGAGAAFLNRDFDLGDLEEDSDTEVGFNLLVGLDGGRISGSSLRPFVEGRWTNVDDYDAFRLNVGINVPISGRGWW